MFKNYLKVAIRNILRNRAFSFIIISGLAVGMATTVLIQLWVKDELGYDRFHKEADQIYRVTMYFPVKGENQSAMTPMVLAPKLNSFFPEIQRITRLKGYGKVMVSYENKQFYEDRFFLADPSIFSIFSFEFIRRDFATALLDPNSVIITEATAKKYFGDTDPIGKLLLVENKDIFKINAIIKNIPSQSHFHFDFLGSLAKLGEIHTPWECWGYTYIFLQKEISIKNLNEKFNKILTYENLGWEIKGMKFQLQPLTDIHFYSYMTGEIEATQDIRYLYILSTVALLILLIACVNFMNMSTARSIPRLKEVGIRKVFGSQRYQLIGQSIEPLSFQIKPEHFDRFFVKIQTENVSATLDLIEQKWCQFVPHRPFEFEFLNEEYDRLYDAELQTGKIFNYFSLLAIFLACQGLFGLAAFATEQRTREIGIRKALGASVTRLVFILTQDFTKCVFVANFFALPITWYAMNKWLQNFAYRITISWWMIVIAGMIALVIALVTVSYQSIKAALANPVESLRYE